MDLLVVENNTEELTQIVKTIENLNTDDNINITVMDCYDQVNLQKKYDIFLLSTGYHNLDSCIDLHKQCQNKKNYIIYLLEEDNLIFDAQRSHAFYCVRKSNLLLDLNIALSLVIEDYSSKYINTKKNGMSININVNDIYAVEIDDHYLELYTNDNHYLIRNTITNFTEKYQFLRINRSISVNPAYIKKKTSNKIILKNNKEYTVSSKYFKNTNNTLYFNTLSLS